MAERRRGTRRRSASEWESLVSELAETGEERAEFCRRQGVKPSTLQWWQWRLRTSGAGVDRRSPRAPKMSRSEGPRFTEVRVADQAPVALRAGFELRWPDGLTLAIPREFDEVALRRLLGVLEVAGC
jgi:transposase-like protein